MMGFARATDQDDEVIPFSSNTLAASRLASTMAESRVDCAITSEPSYSDRIWITALSGLLNDKGSTSDATKSCNFVKYAAMVASTPGEFASGPNSAIPFANGQPRNEGARSGCSSASKTARTRSTGVRPARSVEVESI